MRTITYLPSILVTGANSQMNRALKQIFSKNPMRFYSKENLDVTNEEQVMEIFVRETPDVVIHLASMTNEDHCSNDVEGCYAVNIVGTLNVLQACALVGSEIMYITSYLCHADAKTSYDDQDVPKHSSDLTYFLKSKVLSERLIRKSTVPYAVFRAGHLFGGGKTTEKFVNKIVKTTTNGSQPKYDDINMQYLTYTDDLAYMMHYILHNRYYGFYNAVNSNVTTLKNIAQFIADEIRAECIIEPATTMFQPRNIHLTSSFVDTNKLQIPTWQESMSKYLKKMKHKGVLKLWRSN